MSYLVISIIFLTIIVLAYIVLNLLKENSKFLIMCVHTFSVFIANLLHIVSFNKLFNHCNHCVIYSSSESIPKGIDFSRKENILGITQIDGNDAKMYLVLIVSIITILLLYFANKRNTEKNKSTKILETVGCIVVILIEASISLVIRMM